MSKPSTGSGSAEPDTDGAVEVQVAPEESTKPKGTKRKGDADGGKSPKEFKPKESKPKKPKKEYKLEDFIPNVKMYEEPGVWPVLCKKCKANPIEVNVKFVQSGKSTSKPTMHFIMKCKNEHKFEVEPEEMSKA